MAWFRVSTLGSIGNAEKWSVGMSFAIFGIEPDTADQAETDGLLQSILAAVGLAGVPNYLRAAMSSSCTLDGFRVEKRSEAEKVLNVSQGLFSSPSTGSGSATKTPQDSLVLSLRTATPGPTGRGRLYWPALGATLSSAFVMTTPTPAQAAADAKAFLKEVGDAMNAYYASVSAAKTVVASVRSVKNHTSRNITSIQVGSVLDTQRRRRKSLPESYASVTYP